MSPNTTYDGVSRLYAAAQSAQYGKKDLRRALEIYRGIVTTHPESQEAQYSRSQIRSIVASVVPELEYLQAQVELAFAHLDSSDQPEAGLMPVLSLHSEQAP